jgi:hypothetical protein
VTWIQRGAWVALVVWALVVLWSGWEVALLLPAVVAAGAVHLAGRRRS